jgi:septal ring factor EnvC (AmiA/AmiB activator)
MGVERAVTRWYTSRQVIQSELSVLQARLEQMQSLTQTLEEQRKLEQQIAEVQARLRHLGPCPKSMMG